MLNELSDAEDLAREAKLLLDGVPGGDGGSGAVGAEEVPGVEAGKVLEKTESLVATEGGSDEADVVGDGRVVNEGVGDHGCELMVMMMCLRARVLKDVSILLRDVVQ